MEIRTYHLTGRITKAGRLEVDDLPGDIPPGEVKVTLAVPSSTETETTSQVNAPIWTDEEIAEMMRVEPKTGAEIAKSDAIGAWADRGITDSVEWVKELRRKRRERRGW